MSSRREFRNRLHEQLARRTARDAFRGVSESDGAVTVSCEPCELDFSATSEDALRSELETHYKTPDHRRATQLPMHKQRQEN